MAVSSFTRILRVDSRQQRVCFCVYKKDLTILLFQ